MHSLWVGSAFLNDERCLGWTLSGGELLGAVARDQISVNSLRNRRWLIYHLRAALGIASSFNWHFQLLWVHRSLASLSFNKGRFDDAHTHIEYAKSHAGNDAYGVSRVVELQARFWYGQGKFEDAKSAALHAADAFERLGATKMLKECKVLLQTIERAMEMQF